jgi:twinfilin
MRSNFLKDQADKFQSVDISTETLILNFQAHNILPIDLPSKLPSSHPSLTFYRHLDSSLLYFIFLSPDSAPVKVRMMHTMAIPGLVNIIAKENKVQVDQKIEIHDPEDLNFEEHDERIGRFRSMFLLNGSRGTESMWKGMSVS